MYSAHARFVFLLQLLSPVSSRKFVIAVVLGDTTCGGCTALHLFAKTLRQLGEDVEERYWVNGCPTRSTCLEQHVPLPFMNDNPHRGIGDDTVVIYPEGMRGNPFGGTKVIRWILAPLTIWSDIGLSDNYVTWDAADIVYHWSTYTDNVPDDNVLLAPFLDPMWTNLNLPRQRKSACYSIGPGSAIHSAQYIHDVQNELKGYFGAGFHNAFEIKRQTPLELLKLFNSFDFFIDFDPFSILWMASAPSGCKVVVVPVQGWNKSEWIQRTQVPKSSMDLHRPEMNGVAYGLGDITHAAGTIHLAHQDFYRTQRYAYQTVLLFLDDMDRFLYSKTSKLLTVGTFWPDTIKRRAQRPHNLLKLGEETSLSTAQDDVVEFILFLLIVSIGMMCVAMQRSRLPPAALRFAKLR